MKSPKFAEIGTIGLALLVPAVLTASQDVYTTGFEAVDGFAAQVYNAPATLGDGWELTAGTAEVKSDLNPVEGSQVVVLSSGAQFERSFADAFQPEDIPAEGVFVEGYFRGEGSTLELKDAFYPPSEPASALLHFSSAKGVQALDGNGDGSEGTIITTDVPLGAAHAATWYRVTVYMQFGATKKWDLYVDGVKKASELGFRDNVTTLSGFRNLAETPSAFDSFRVVFPLIGDANGDSAIDSADVVTTVEYEVNGTSDPIRARNADIDGDGTIEIEDWMTLANRIAGIPDV
ncbi:hypothetical protein HZA57_04620 [Candidatus Poribacteria bacterium]|nr:hypothetical protein [Candidatus Poribacteria bacterium]